jgi:4-alpha-glucanotransferase
LAGAPSLLVSATLDDALAVVERPNMPGTITEWPNWCLALPVPLDEIETHPLANRVARVLHRRG